MQPPLVSLFGLLPPPPCADVVYEWSRMKKAAVIQQPRAKTCMAIQSSLVFMCDWLFKQISTSYRRRCSCSIAIDVCETPVFEASNEYSFSWHQLGFKGGTEEWRRWRARCPSRSRATPRARRDSGSIFFAQINTGRPICIGKEISWHLSWSCV